MSFVRTWRLGEMRSIPRNVWQPDPTQGAADPIAVHAGKPLRLGIVGCGAAVRAYHLPTLIEMPGVVVAVLCDKNRESAIFARRLFGLQALTTDDVTQLRGRVDAALVATPPRSHASISVELLEMGLDVLCEKPLATTCLDAEHMMKAASQHGRILAVGLMTRFHPCNDVMRAILSENLLGEVIEISAEHGRRLEWPVATSSFYSRECMGGGVLMDLGVHLLDRVLWLFGELDDVEFEDDSDGGPESNALLRGILSVAGKRVPCRMAFSWTHSLKNRIVVKGCRASAEMRLSEPEAVIMGQLIASQAMELRVSREANCLSAPRFHSFRRQWEDFVGAVRTRGEPFVSAASAVHCLRIVEKAYSVRRRMDQPWVDR